MLKKVRALNRATAPSIHACQKISSRLRSKMSAVAPASSPSMTTGRLAAVCIRAIKSGEGVRTVINQVPAVSCIQPPRFEMVAAIQSFRKRGAFSGSKPVECSSGAPAGSCTRSAASGSPADPGDGLGGLEKGMAADER